ncbi:hypothetical protein TCSYLVIO_003778 [Trypanosoma cruzi]|uniref:glucose-6-phosphate 1-epimerase n=2 Tax=Trypanosoma cruzi TaxID=5693 RepID=V5BV57_TRYCR|nr:hypothetical protein TCSYLVIO_003778 [Trypanosoma cruzi]ESS68438.1 hypothetical protein TCDM_02831 [Trypanosoma cruzi Dm28c]PBJ68908.1 hypothetical protein BCY84_20601 [Trypanosoma cruzi cruzi]PWV00154.1 hypothetical protein C4B63_7g302 [Trypanosoma cruzi]RNF21990.1 aldose 1-epimerase-like protein [Trypanosoma cruzi]
MSKSVVEAKNEDGSSITVHTQGAHLTSWRTREGEEILYTSPNAVYKQGVPIRGGVPIIFPQFGNRGPLPAHGFARIREWNVKELRSGMASFTLELPSSELRKQGAELRHNNDTSASGTVSLLYTITFSNEQLKLQMEVTSHDTEADIIFTFAFHTYFAVGDITKTRVDGVNTTSFINNLKEQQALQSPEPLWCIREEVDRIYVDQKSAVSLLDQARHRTVHVSGENLPDVVLWNPWVEKTARLNDLPLDGYNKFVCVEHGSIAKEVILPPKGVWKASQCISSRGVSNL